MIEVNLYTIKMMENDASDYRRSMETRATSKEEAIRKVIENPFWYDEGVGKEFKPLKYPLTFTAEEKRP